MKIYDLKKKVVIRPATKENGYNGYYEVPYIEYREDGSILCEGTEDFSGDRLKTLKTYEVVKQTGEKTKRSSINVGGRNRWKHVCWMDVNTRKEAVKIANFLFHDDIIQIR